MLKVIVSSTVSSDGPGAMAYSLLPRRRDAGDHPLAFPSDQ